MQAGDNGSRELLESILRDEEDHIDWLGAQIDQIKQMGIQLDLAEQGEFSSGFSAATCTNKGIDLAAIAAELEAVKGRNVIGTSSSSYDINSVTPIISARCNSSAMNPRMIRASSVDGSPGLDHVGR